jgi:predicted DNA-binding transcriptional regulator AlpA
MRDLKTKNTEAFETAVNSSGPRLLSKAEVLARLGGVAYTSVFTWMLENDFPRAIELGPPGGRSTKIAWLADEVDAWIASRPRRKLGRHEYRGRRGAG